MKERRIDMHKEIQEGRTCTLHLDPESPAAIEFGKEVYGKVHKMDKIEAMDGTLGEMYPEQNFLSVIVVEDEAGLFWQIPAKDVQKIVCGDEELCE